MKGIREHYKRCITGIRCNGKTRGIVPLILLKARTKTLPLTNLSMAIRIRKGERISDTVIRYRKTSFA
jgi:CO dehydrogenase/acetyl-CoA synthase alpha subunit